MDLDEFKLLSEINPEDITKVYKINIIFKFMNIKAEQPNLTQEQISKKLGISSSTIKRIRQDLNVKSPYRYDIPLKSKNKEKVKTPENKKKITPQKKNEITLPKKKEKTGFGAEFDLDKEMEKI